MSKNYILIQMNIELNQNLTNALKQKFTNDLLSIVLFGSIIKGTFTGTSDIDVLVVCENLINDWRARDKIALELTEDIELKYTTPIHMILVSKDEVSHSIESVNPLMLEIYETNEIVYDRDDFFKQLLISLEKNLHRWHAEKLEKGVWEIPGLAVIESG